jgi:pantoate--beta-alanine ligase
MGYLHAGHLSLVRAARAENDHVAVSIFVNPTQFGPREDYATYPRDMPRDAALLRREDVDVLFTPSVQEMYPNGYATYVQVDGPLTAGLCGASRPGHFRGVATVVAKLFGLVRPTRAYFGEKDAQQLLVVRRMTEDLNLGVQIVPCPIVRDEDGLATSSRNARLSPEERRSALSLYGALQRAQAWMEAGESDAAAMRARLLDHFASVPGVRVDYVEFVDADTLTPTVAIRGHVMLAVAVFVGTTRLIDNVRLRVDGG